jgi:hypothetical protein
MNTKEALLEELSTRLKDMFVEDYDKVNGAKNDINVYLESIGIKTKYNYNDFCSDFLKVSDNLIQSLTLEDIINVDSTIILGEVMSIMVKYKIMDNEPDEEKRLHKILQHELKTKMVREGKIDSS